MTELLDGFLYHPDGGSPTDQLKRLLAGEENLVLDDLFSTTLHEANDAILKAEKDHAAAEERLRRLECTVKELKEHKVKVSSAIDHFEKTGEIDDVLYPTCNKLLTAERREFLAADAKVKEKEIEDAEAAARDALGPD